MDKIAIVTLNDNNNYGNRLQNYAVQFFINKIDYNAESIINIYGCRSLKYKIKSKLKYFIKPRYKSFIKFNNNICFSKYIVDNSKILDCGKMINDTYKYFIVGSDQVWNPTLKRFCEFELLPFSDNEKRISFAASFAINELPEEFKEKFRIELLKYKAISVREDRGKEIVEDLTGRKDVEVLIDPTMLLTAEEWDKVSKKPKMLKTDKYILNYFLGELSEERKKEIDRIAKENDCEVINILDVNSPFYKTGPSEFLYLEKNAFLICTDSFHSSVFAILYNRPFIVFTREDKTVSMNSRIETLINKFNLKNRNYEGKITKENLEHDFTEAYKILELEREKSKRFLEKALDIK